jgi:hypothetical protein
MNMEITIRQLLFRLFECSTGKFYFSSEIYIAGIMDGGGATHIWALYKNDNVIKSNV